MLKPFIPGRPHWWQWLTVLSVDAPLVALVWQALFARLLDVELFWYQSASLGLAVWVIYMADRWIEGWRLSYETVLTQRHFFPIRWRWPVFWTGLVAALVAAWVAVAKLSGREWAAHAVLAVPTLTYLLSHQFVHRSHPSRVPKELCIAVLFALGTALEPALVKLRPVWDRSGFLAALSSHQLDALWVPLGLFALLCLANVGLIAVWESDVDTQHGQTSIALQLSGKVRLIRAFPWLLVPLGFWAALGGSGEMGRLAGSCVVLSASLMGALDWLEPRIGREAARALVDVTLLTPIAALFFL